MTARPPALLLATLTVATFLTTVSSVSIAPFLLDMARDLGTDLAGLGTLVALSSVSWGAASLTAGIASDRFGRRSILVIGLLVFAASRFGIGLAGAYLALAFWQIVSGAGGGAYTGTVFAAASDQVPPEQRGRAMGSIITGQSLGLVLGLPLITLLGSFTGWRGAAHVQGVAVLLSALSVFLVMPAAAAPDPQQPAARKPRLVPVLRPRLVALLGASMMERACFSGVMVYLATYLIESYRLSLGQLAPLLALVTLGNLAGNLVGGPLADRWPARALTFAATSVGTAILAVPLLLIQPGLALSVAAGFGYSLVNALGRPSLLAALSEVPRDVSGAVLGLNITCGSTGWLLASGVGGWLIARFGFGGLGVLSVAAALTGAALAVVASLAPRPPGEP